MQIFSLKRIGVFDRKTTFSFIDFFCPRFFVRIFMKWLGNIHVLRNQDLGFSDPPPPPFVITFSTERNQKLPFSDPPLPPL